MRNSNPKSINILFAAAKDSSCPFFSQFQQHIMLLLKLNNIVNTLLPVSLRPWCRVANFRHSVIVLETANANWLMRLYYEQNQLLSTLHTYVLPSLSAIEIKINPELTIKKFTIK